MNFIELLEALINKRNDIEGTIESVNQLLDVWPSEVPDISVFGILETEVELSYELINNLRTKANETVLDELDEVLNDIEGYLSESTITDVREYNIENRAEDYFREIEEEEGFEEDSDHVERGQEQAEEKFRELVISAHDVLENLNQKIESFVETVDGFIG